MQDHFRVFPATVQPMSSPVLTATSVYSLTVVAAFGVVAYAAAKVVLPKNARWQDRFTFVWLAFDAMIHFSFEGSWIYLSTFGRTVNSSSGVFAELWKEYTRADFRWGIADPTLVSLELLTVLGVAPLCCYILCQLVRNDPARHFWIVVISTAELYGGFVTFAPEWLTGSQNLDTSNALLLWVYLAFMNIIWVVVPLWLLFDSYKSIASSLRFAQSSSLEGKHK